MFSTATIKSHLKILLFLFIGSISLVSLASLLHSNQRTSATNQNLILASIPGRTGMLWMPNPKLNSLQAYLDKSDHIRRTHPHDPDFFRAITYLIARNYKHSELKTRWSDNWIAHLLAASSLPKIRHFDSAIRPQTIAQSKYAFCSQVSILIAAILKSHNISFHSIGFSGDAGHFAIIAESRDGKKFLLDANVLPKLPWDGSTVPRLLSGGQQTIETFRKIYSTSTPESISVELDNFNRIPAWRSLFLRDVLALISHWIWIPSLLFLLRQLIPLNQLSSRKR